MGEIAMFISGKAQPGKRDEVYELFVQHLAPAAEANAAQEIVVWCRDQQDPDAFHLFEMYTNGEALGANAQSQPFADYMAAAGPLLAEEPRVGMTTPAWSKGL